MIPAIIAAAAALIAAGGATGKIAQKVGDSKANKARAIIQDTQTYLTNQRHDFQYHNRQYAKRLGAYSASIRKVVGQAPLQGRKRELPAHLQEFWETVAAPWAGTSGHQTDARVWSMSQEEIRHMGAVGRQASAHPLLVAAAWGFLFAKKGFVYALDASASLERVEAWSVESRRAVDAAIASLKLQFETMEHAWKTIMVPEIDKASKNPSDEKIWNGLIQMADLLQETYRQRLSEASERPSA